MSADHGADLFLLHGHGFKIGHLGLQLGPLILIPCKLVQLVINLIQRLRFRHALGKHILELLVLCLLRIR